MSLVLDNSISMRWLFGDGKSRDIAYARNVLEAIKNTQVFVPVTWGLEVANVLVRAEAKALVTNAHSQAFLELLESINPVVDEATFTRALSDNLQLARRYKLSAYDASYLELALRSGLPIATLDQDLLKAAAKTGVKRFA